MLWHWNSWWEPRPDNPTQTEPPPLWRGPWGVEHVAAWQARNWEHLLSASRSVWSFWLASLPIPSTPLIGRVAPPSAPHEVQPEPPPRPVHEARPPRSAPARKRSAQPDGRHSLQTRKH